MQVFSKKHLYRTSAALYLLTMLIRYKILLNGNVLSNSQHIVTILGTMYLESTASSAKDDIKDDSKKNSKITVEWYVWKPEIRNVIAKAEFLVAL